ncbi:MAG: flagellar export chaperone FliS [Gammaproteobacteria bacterium]|nr:flagellar export chaperone FliS [Gammaproteobacteria bacterium]MBL6999864.1 flagellar export chaperone FliS [Gammaproteobacteria bacterium]
MNKQQNLAKSYQSTETYSGVAYADPHSLITRMFDGALRKIAQAKGAIERNLIADKGELIGDAINIIGSLDACLDHEKGAEISKNLGDLYEYMIFTLASANINNDKRKLDEVSRLILEIKSAWVQIAPQHPQKVG